MKLDIFNIDKFVEVNKCPEVTNPVFWNFDGTPTTDGLFSYELFGVSDEERKNTFGYIDLKANFIHPIIYQMLVKKSGSLGDIVTCQKYAVIADGKIKIVDEDFDGAETGLSFIYDHFDEINWIDELEEDEIESISKKTRLKFLKSLERDEFFIRKWLVLPPFYRAESSSNRSMGDNINKLYKELISRVSGMSLGYSFEIFGDETKLRIQNILRDIYLTTLAPVSGKNLIMEKGKPDATHVGSGKNSMIRKHLIGKNIDWGASSVITSPPNSDANKLSEKPVPFGYGAFPLATLISLFHPFYVHYLSLYFERLLLEFELVNANDIKKINTDQLTSKDIEKILKTFIKSPNQRFDPVTFKYTNLEGKEVKFAIEMYEFESEKDIENGENYVKRPMTITDFIFMATKEFIEDKHVLVTRFPITNYQNIYPSGIKVLSTNKTRDIYVTLSKDAGSAKNAIHYTDYPTIPNDKTHKLDSDFYDVMLCGNVYLDSLGGDYDGDMLYLRGLFTQEANHEAKELIWSKTNMFNAKGNVSRGISKISKECVMRII